MKLQPNNLHRNPLIYQGAMQHLSVQPAECAMVAAHIHDLKAAQMQGMRTIYVRRETEDPPEVCASVKPKAEGGEVDLVVDNLEELAHILHCI